jgi:choline-phosphate cytidylyltransferase
MEPSVLSDDGESDYDVVSNPDQDRRDESFSVADLSNSTTYGHVPVSPVLEPPPTHAAREKLDTVGLSETDIQSFVAKALDSSTPDGTLEREVAIATEGRTLRVYVDGIFDPWNAGWVR